MVKKVFVCLIVATGLWGCDDCTSGIKGSCDPPTGLGKCPAETYLDPKTCVPSCDIGGIDIAQLGPDSCEVVDCFTLECITDEGETALVEDLEDFRMDQMVVITLDGEDPIDSECTFFFADGPTC